ncbi:MAG TPA: MG2 domain-containing protein, partial [Saliniramus sp.]|nr:MG2 domain-containing protein [Saliniramus sp.]
MVAKLFRSLMLSIAIVFSGAAWAQFTPFDSPDLNRDSVRIQEQIANEIVQAMGRPLAPGDQYRAQGETATMRGDPRGALEPFAAAFIADPRDHGAWLGYARAAQAISPRDWNERYQLQERAAVAAYQAYRTAPDAEAEAEALAALGEAQALRENWRPAIDAYKASIDRGAEQSSVARYEELRAQYGFRILGYDVDSDSASPRVCFNFSESLRARYDFTPFVAVAGASNAAVTVEDRQLCVDGLRFGDRYAIVLRQGLPSAIGEDLLANADYEVYVRDRSPQVRFTGRNYVLPRLGQDGIPVVSVNADTISVDMFRIGDRGLLGSLRSREFLSQIERYSADEIAEQRGLKVWSGELDVTPELNQEVVTAFPVLETVGALEPGVYVMTAQVKGLVAADSDWGARATQWFVVSDLGLTAFSGPDGVHVLVRSLATAEALDGVEISLIALNNEILATATADENGHVHFDPGLSRGSQGLSPALVTARLADDYGFLDLQQSAFDLSDRGVTGRPAPGPLEAYVFPERGVYRSGETVNLTALLRTATGEAAAGLPLTLVVRRPDGVEDRRASVSDQGLGGRAHAIALLSNAMRGTWRVSAHVDPNGPAVGEASFLVEDYVPERIELTLTPRDDALQPGQTAEIEVDARYLFGAPGAGLEVTGEISVTPATESGIRGLENYEVGLQDEHVESFTAEVEETTVTDSEGRALFSAAIPAIAALRPLQARIAVRVAETGGRAIERSVTLPILPDGPVIGIRKTFTELADGANATFDIVAAQPDGTRVSGQAKWDLYRVEKRYQWFRSDGRWGYEPVTTSSRVADGRIDLASGNPARI